MARMKTFLMVAAGAVVSTLGAPALALAADHEGGATAAGMIAIGSGIAISVAAFGTALGQGRAVAAAMESIGRNPSSADRIQTPMIIGIAFMEALSIYALVIAFFLQGKI